MEEIRSKFQELAGERGEVRGQEALMQLAVSIGRSKISGEEKEEFFNALKDRCLSERGRITEEEFNLLINRIVARRNLRR